MNELSDLLVSTYITSLRYAMNFKYILDTDSVKEFGTQILREYQPKLTKLDTNTNTYGATQDVMFDMTFKPRTSLSTKMFMVEKIVSTLSSNAALQEFYRGHLRVLHNVTGTATPVVMFELDLKNNNSGDFNIPPTAVKLDNIRLELNLWCIPAKGTVIDSVIKLSLI